MKYLIYSFLFFSLLSRADDLLPEGTEVEAKPEAAVFEPVSPSETPSLALPVESPAIATATSVSTATQVAPLAPAQALELAVPVQEPAGNFPYEVPAEVAEESAVPVDITAQQPIPPPVAVPQINYGPSAEEGYGSVGLKNEGQFMEVGGDKKTEEITVEDGDRKTSSLPEETAQ